MRLVCELAYEDPEAQQYICASFGFTPLDRKMCLNCMPQRVQTMLARDPSLLQEIKKQTNIEATCKFWSYPLFITTMESKDTVTDDLTAGYPDPLDCWIGFYCTPVCEQSTSGSTMRESERSSHPHNPIYLTQHQHPIQTPLQLGPVLIALDIP